MRKLSLFVVLVIVALPCARAAELVVHEWGTITTLHDVSGQPQSRLNRIDAADVLPRFVHQFEPEHTRDDPARRLAKSPLVPGRPDVTMRLETPVIYFHPPAGAAYETPIDVEVKFRGGILNEFYPAAEAAFEIDQRRMTEKISAGVLQRQAFDVLDRYVVGSLAWRGVRIHDTVVAPLTDNPVWTAPRDVQAGSVFIPEAGEGERFLFYRGVANLEALVQTRVTSRQVRLTAPQILYWVETSALTVPNVWLAEIRADGVIAFREHGPLVIPRDKGGADLGRLQRFAAGDFTPDGAQRLRASLRRALLREGLYADEAEAMLKTWQSSYFAKPGLRLFYVVPRPWLDHHLPLKLSVPARIERAILGRIDFVGG